MIQVITLQEAIELVHVRATVYTADILRELKGFGSVVERIQLYTGDTVLPGLVVGKDIVVVDGNLTVDGLIEDCDGVDSSLLVVLGDVMCKNLITLSSIYITGNLSVKDIVLGDSLCDYALKVGGDLQTRTIVEGGHWFEVAGELRGDYVFRSVGSIKDRHGVVKPNLADSDLMEDFRENPEAYEGFEYVEMIAEMQKDGVYNLGRVVRYIKGLGDA